MNPPKEELEDETSWIFNRLVEEPGRDTSELLACAGIVKRKITKILDILDIFVKNKEKRAKELKSKKHAENHEAKLVISRTEK